MSASGVSSTQVGLTLREGDGWWKLFIDGRDRVHGPEVYHEGLHEGAKEPGYLSSIKVACEFASSQLGQPLTIESYRKIHELACRHFSKVDPRSINVKLHQVDEFRDTHCSCCRKLNIDSYDEEDASAMKKREYEFIFLNSLRINLLYRKNISTESASKLEFDRLNQDVKEQLVNQLSDVFSSKGFEIVEILKNGGPIYEAAIESKLQAEQQLAALQEQLGLPKPLVSFKFNEVGTDFYLNLSYNYKDPVEIEAILRQLLDRYHEKMQALPPISMRNDEENERALGFIAELFQHLEWLHPFFDGQGRTDLIVLAKLLTENGFNPPLLYFPYFSTFEPLKKWVPYLKEGIKNWQDEFAAISS